MAIANAAFSASFQNKLSAQQLKTISDFVRHKAGIVLGEKSSNLVESRLSKRLRELSIDNYDAYLSRALDPSHRESTALIDILTTNKTSFFREMLHFDFIKNEGLPERLSCSGRGQPVSFWSAACSTGEEPYSLAMLLHEITQETSRLPSKILATDISTQVLRTAINGVYDAESVHQLTPLQRRTFFVELESPLGRLYKMKDALQRTVDFRRFNLIKGPYRFKSGFDFIFCRNVLIYFDEETRTKVVRNLVSSLKPGGFLLTGHSETINTDLYANLFGLAPCIYKKEGG